MGLTSLPFVKTLLEVLSSLSNKLLLAALIFLFGLIIARLSGKIAQKFLHELGINSLFRSLLGVETAIDEVLGIIISGVVYAFTFLFILRVLGLDLLFINFIAIITLAILIVSMLIVLQNAIPNIFAGILIRHRKMILVNDHLKLRSLSGVVMQTGLFEVQVQTKEKDILYLPNSSLLKEKYFTVKRL